MACSTSASKARRFMPPTYLLLFLLVAVALRFALPFFAYVTPLTLALGLTFLLLGIALNLAADAALKKSATPISPDATPVAFVTSGVFGLTRNPMYLGMVLIVAAAALLAGVPAGLIAAGAFALLLDRLFILREERNLEAAFGTRYAAYKASVRRWI